MKKLLLLAAVAMGSFSAVNAQVDPCTPNPNYTPTGATGAGIEDLPCAKTNLQYKASSTVVIPVVITTEFGGNQATIRVCSVRVDNINNWPAFASTPQWAIFSGANQYAAGMWIPITASTEERACVSINATFTAPYNDSVVVEGVAKVSLTPANCNATIEVPFSQFDAANGGLPIGLVVADDCNFSVAEELSNNSFDVAQNFPNPVTGQSQIVYNVPAAGKVNFRITNLVGSVIADKTLAANSGKNFIDINANSFAPGVYMYSLSYNGSTVTKRMIVK